jgi:hypothetical protein
MPFRFMTLRFSLRKLATTTVLLAMPAMLLAQEMSSSEEERLQRLMSDAALFYVPNNRVSIGFRKLSSGGKVTFGNLGNVPFEITVPAASEGEVARTYNNGYVAKDALRTDESEVIKDDDGNVIETIQKSTPGGRYATYTTSYRIRRDANGDPVLDENGEQLYDEFTVQTGESLAYTPGQTRVWAYGSASQVTADGTHIAMSTYQATPNGHGFIKDADSSSGVEFQYVRTLSKPTARLQWGVLTGIALNGINSKNAGSVLATLHTRTDYYSLLGKTAPTAPYAGPSFENYYDPATGELITHPDTGANMSENTLENTVPIATTPDGHTETTTPDGVEVQGVWQVKGAYFMVRLGPSVRTNLTTRLGLNASLGVAGAYAGTTYSVSERFVVPGLTDTYVGNSSGIAESRATKFLSGYYADLNLEWAANERTGLFTGVTAQKFEAYDQEVGGRTARIDLGSTVGIRGGVSIRF